MGKFAKKPKTNNGPKSRKTIRKEKRQEKKQRKHDYYVNRSGKAGKFVLNQNNKQFNNNIKENDLELSKSNKNDNKKSSQKNVKQDIKKNKKVQFKEVDSFTEGVMKDKRKQQKLQNEMKKQRKIQLEEANRDEDKIIKRLEKDLKLNKRKSKSIPKSFEVDGLDYLLEMCDPEKVKNVVSSEQQFTEGNNDFEEDFALISGKTKKSVKDKDASSESEEEIDDPFFKTSLKSKKLKQNNKLNNIEPKSKKMKTIFDDEDDQSNSDVDMEDVDFSDSDMDADFSHDLSSHEDETEKKSTANSKLVNNKKEKNRSSDKIKENNAENGFYSEDENEKASSDFEDEFDSDEDSDMEETNFKVNKKSKKSNNLENVNETVSNSELDSDLSENDSDSNGNPVESDNSDEKNSEQGVWEDIYGRKRTKDGDILQAKTDKYIPPALRTQNDTKRSEKLNRLRKQCKGLLNRLAESNMHSISTQIEELYMSNSRNDMNETWTQIIFDSLISPVHTPERLLLEHVMLIAILHANVGTEVGATFLLNVIKKFDELLTVDYDVENKQLDNAVHIIAQLYNFKVFHAQLLYQIIEKLSSKFEEKHVECILLILKNVGFSLRKDDPVALKQIILDLQKRASTISDDNARVKYMLNILLAIKNNNVTKIPNYDTSYSEHLKKLMKSFVRKGNYVTQLNISLEDLLKADERGKWWVVGSAWAGMDEKKQNTDENSKVVMPTYSKKLLELAKKQRMNTDTRRNIFCVIMTAEDYLDAFEKLLHLGLKNQQEREIIHVILHCSLSEKNFNPYYAVLVQKFCDYDRRFQMTIRCSIWDKLKALTDCSGSQLSNMAKLLAHLFIQQSLPISTLKVIEFGELDKITLRFMRQVLLSILLHEDQEACLAVFSRVSSTPKLKMFRDSLRLFIHHFLLKNLKEGMIEENQQKLLISRAQMVEKALISSEHKGHLM